MCLINQIVGYILRKSAPSQQKYCKGFIKKDRLRRDSNLGHLKTNLIAQPLDHLGFSEKSRIVNALLGTYIFSKLKDLC